MSLNVPNYRLKFGTAKLYSDSVLRLLLTVLALLLPMRMSLHLLLNHLRQKVRRAAAPAADLARKFKSRCKDDWDPVVVPEAYKKRFLHRQMSLTDLPAPQVPDNLDNMTCLYRLERFPTSSRCSSHSLACTKTPYKEWLRRVRICQYDFTDSQFTCPHCGTGLATQSSW